MESFTDADRDRAIKALGLLQAMISRLEAIERGQRRVLIRQRRAPAVVAKAVSQAVTRRAAILIAVGVAIGSALGGAASELVRRLVTVAIAGH